ncbi:MAG TPA: hypothetical protein VFJ95_16105, partial [Gammaproteobacteria bacterium]|nr:hypothetical protein [Gammaproteobacteria bacterium]
MSSQIVRSETAPLLVAASIATLAAVAVLDTGVLLPAWVGALAQDPFTACLVLLVAALESMWQRRRVTALLASAAAVGLGG